MINRILIRVKVVQMMYNYLLTSNIKSQQEARDELQLSLDKSYELYHYYLLLIVELTRLQDLNLDEAKHKFLPTDEDLHPNTRFVDNWLAKQLEDDEQLQQFVKEHPFSWRDNEVFLRLLLNKVLNSNEYRTYMDMPATDNPSDCELWRQLLKNVIIPDDDFAEEVENRSIYWSSDDVDFMGQFAVKTLRRYEHGDKPALLPQYKNDDDRDFARQLFAMAIDQQEQNNELINRFITQGRWDADRIATFDRVVMLVAIAELKGFPSIPTTVTLNEYIELAKRYSTPASGAFVNGVLNAVVVHLKKTKEIIKN